MSRAERKTKVDRCHDLPISRQCEVLAISRLPAYRAPVGLSVEETEAGRKSRWMDYVFIERLWRSLIYEDIYLKAYDSVDQAKQSIGDWMSFYNQDRRHTSHGVVF